jgi:hypothetical protein
VPRPASHRTAKNSLVPANQSFIAITRILANGFLDFLTLTWSRKENLLAAQVTGSKTVTRDVSPAATAAVLTALLAIPIENLTIAQFGLLDTALRKVPGGHAPTATIGGVLK